MNGQGLHPAGLDDRRLVARADGEHFQDARGGPQELLVVVGPHDPDELQRSLAGQDDQLALLGTDSVEIILA